MKFLRNLLPVLALFGLLACDKDQNDDLVEVLVARPLTISIEDFRAPIDLVAPEPMAESGKIYAYRNTIFVSEPGKGIHLIDNSDPAAPVKTGFIRIPGTVDLSVKGDYLFADSLRDLVVLDISDPDNIRPVARLEDVLEDNVPWPFEADVVEGWDWDPSKEILVGWEQSVERRPAEEISRWQEDVLFNGVAESAAGDTGTGGSLARFKIVSDYLYVVDRHNINVFDISDLEAPQVLPDVFAGFDIETIFNRGEQLFLGSMRGMYIYDISDPAAPAFISEFQHGTACDPVVVDGDYAYVTLRGGNGCGATESGLYIVDISTITQPELVTQYPLDGPYGLGISGTLLFVCDGPSGLKVYDRSDVFDLQLLDQFKDIFAYDVIPLEDRLLLVGDGIISQYRYDADALEWLSSLDLKS